LGKIVPNSLLDLIKSAEAGNVEAQYNLGISYYSDKDFKQAVVWFTKAAEQNHPKAQTALGLCYFNGKGVKQDYKQAIKWLIKAAEQGNANAQFNLGSCYVGGYGVNKNEINDAQGIEWLKKAAEQNVPDAQYVLGRHYFFGICGVEKDFEQALKWFTKAAEQDNAEAKKMLNSCIGTIQNKRKLPSKRKEVFVSYTSKDEKYVEEMKPFLKSLERDHKIPIWYYQRLNVGDKWREEIHKHMSSARVAVLLVSQEFLASDFVYGVELPDLLQAAVDENAEILWVPVRLSTVKDVRIKCKNGKEICINDYQAVCDPKKPLQEMNEVERVNIYNELYYAIKMSTQKQESVVLDKADVSDDKTPMFRGKWFL